MPKQYTVQAPDGRTITIEGPEGASEAEVIAQAQQLYQPQARRPTHPAPVTVAKATPTVMDQLKTLGRRGVVEPLTMLGSAAGNVLGAQLSGGKVGSVGTGGTDASLTQLPGALLEGVTSGPGKLYGGITENDPTQFAEGAAETITGTLPAIFGVRAGVRGAVKTATTPDALMTRAATSRTNAVPPQLPPTTTVMALANAMARYTRLPRAYIQEWLAKQIADTSGPIQALMLPEDFPSVPFSNKTTTPTEMANAARTEGARVRQAQTGQLRTPLTEQPPVSVPRPEARTVPTKPVDVAAEEAARIRSLEPLERIPFQESEKLNIPRPDPRAFDTELMKQTPQSALVNRWMNVSAKEVQRGANPGQQLINEKLIGPTKEATRANVEMALVDSGLKMDSVLVKAGDRGVTINAEPLVQDALVNAAKRIGAPKDATFQAQLSGILDDILTRYPNLAKLQPREAHALKVDLGDAIKWSGEAYQQPVNRALVEMYQDINGAVKSAIPEIAAEQGRWGNLYIANKSLAESLAKDAVGRGTGPTLTPKK